MSFNDFGEFIDAARQRADIAKQSVYGMDAGQTNLPGANLNSVSWPVGQTFMDEVCNPLRGIYGVFVCNIGCKQPDDSTKASC